MKDYKELQNGSDIRGVALKTEGGKNVNLTFEAAADLAKGFALYLAEKTGKAAPELKIALGRDSRVTGAALLDACSNALTDMGITVLDCGMATTPAMFMSTVYENIQADGSVEITASHLPPERNGLKFFTKDGGLDKADIKNIIEKAENLPALSTLSSGVRIDTDLMDEYAKKTREIICNGLSAEEKDLPLKGLKIAVDAGNGASGFYAKEVLERLGADCSGSQFLDPDGMFPNHIPNPENKQAMESVCEAVKKSGSDLGIIFDTDGDRSAAVDEKGNEIARNRIVALAAVIAMEGHSSTTVVTDSITSPQLADFLTKDLGLKHLRFKRGYKNVINKGIELNNEGTDCQLAIETSGHAAMKANYFLDDGAYLATRIVIKLAKLKKEGKAISSLLESLKDPLEAKEFRFDVNTENFGDYAQGILDDLKKKVEEGFFPGMSLELPNFEGVRVNCSKGCGWFLLRKSLHDPVMPLNIESDKEGGVQEIYKTVTDYLKAFDKLVI